MHTSLRFVATTVAFVSAVQSFGAPVAAVEVTKASGGSVKTMLSPTIAVNSDSSLMREWIAVKHAGVPAKLRSTPGVTTIYREETRYTTSGYEYRAAVEFDAGEPLTAIEIRFITFDVWGERQRSLVLTEVQDFKAGYNKLTGTWNLYSENECSEFYASIAYVSRVRTKDGRVIVADVGPVIAEARKFNAKFTETDLTPDKPTKPGK